MIYLFTALTCQAYLFLIGVGTVLFNLKELNSFEKCQSSKSNETTSGGAELIKVCLWLVMLLLLKN